MAKSQGDTTDANHVTTEKEEDAYLTGWKLFTTMFSLTFIVFLLLLDVSVVTTVRCFFFLVRPCVYYLANIGLTGYTENHL
jgi:hypothetical protein